MEVLADTVQEAWDKLAQKTSTSIPEMKQLGVKLVREVHNAAPDFKAAMAAFEAHVKSCAKCRPVYDAAPGSSEADAKNLCPTGAQLLVADLENVQVEPEHLDQDAADLEEIKRHAEGIEHEVKEMASEDAPLQNAIGQYQARQAEHKRDLAIWQSALQAAVKSGDQASFNRAHGEVADLNSKIAQADGVIKDLQSRASVADPEKARDLLNASPLTQAAREAAGAAAYGSAR